MTKKVILITGSSRGIGKLTAIKLAEQGHIVYATMRQPNQCDWLEGLSDEIKERVVLKALDVTDDKQVQSVVSEMIEGQGRVDAVVNNAGYGLFAPVELSEIEEVKQQFDVNVYGVLRVCQAVLPQMRKQKFGHICNISSVAGIVSNPGLGVYCGTKHALEAISQSLASTVFPWNIKVTVIEPAATATEFIEVMAVGKRLKTDNPYSTFSEKYRERMAELINEGQPPEEVADLIAEVIQLENPDFRYQTSDRGREIARNTLVEPTGNEWIKGIKDNFSEWLMSQ